MTNPVLVVRNEVNAAHEVLCRGAWVWCPGCDEAHRLRIPRLDGGAPEGPTWGFDGNLEAPTFTPSLLCHGSPASEGYAGRPTCHSFIRAGTWEFLGDSTHALAGQTVPMVPLPDWLI